jgi:hypothetical protein
MKKILLVVGLLSLAIAPLTANTAPEATSEIVLDGQMTDRAFEGLGGLSAGASSRLLIEYPEPQRSEILDFLFKPKYGASLQHLKVEIGGDVNSTDGTEPSIARTREEFINPKPEYFNRGYEWWLMKEAKKRNPSIIFDALQWGAPAWIGDGKFYSQDNADFIAAFIKGAKQYHDLDIGYCGIWNERKYDVQWIKLLRKTLDSNGLERVKIVAADETYRWTIADRMAKDSQLNDAVQVVGSHYLHFKTTPTAQSLGKPLWASEEGPWSGNWAATSKGCAGLAQSYNRNYVLGKMTKTIIWSLISCYYDIFPMPRSGLMHANQPWSGHYEVQPAIWLTAHTTQFIEPGWKYLGGNACRMLPDGGSCVAAISPDGRDFSIVVETMDAKQPQNLSFRLTGGLAGTQLRAWRSTEKEQFVHIEDILVKDGFFTLQAEPEAIYSLTTTDGQQKGATVIPASSPLPLPYKENFEDYASGQTPKLLSDFIGAFETTKSSDGRKCLVQTLAGPGIAWAGDYLPITVVGDMTWRNYEAECDIRMDFKKDAYIYGRVSNLDVAGKQVSTGYFLKISADGTWQLATPKKQLLAGKASKTPDAWHRFGLRMIDNRITVLDEGKVAGEVTDDTFKKGFCGLGCGWEAVKFADLLIAGFPQPKSLETKNITSSSDWSADYLPLAVADGDLNTRWNSAKDKSAGEWLCFDFGQEQKVSRMYFRQHGQRIIDYRIQAFLNDRWVDVAKGNAAARDECALKFNAVKTRRIRILVDSTIDSETATIYELEFFE